MAKLTLITFTANTTAKASEVNSNFDDLNTMLGAEHNTDGTHDIIDYTAIKQNLVTATDGATVTFDLDTSNVFSVTLGGNRTLAVSNADTGQCFVLRLVQDGTGSRTVTWFNTIKWTDGTEPSLSTDANAVDLFGFICTGSNQYDGVVVSQNLS